MAGIHNAQRAFAVLSLTPCDGSVSAHKIEALCAGIPGVGALRVDADRGRIHLLYDGTVAAVEQIERALRLPGHTIRLLGARPPAPHRAPAAEGSV
jgi:hypothetical protein